MRSVALLGLLLAAAPAYAGSIEAGSNDDATAWIAPQDQARIVVFLARRGSGGHLYVTDADARVCYATVGAKRYTTFTVDPGKGQLLLVFAPRLVALLDLEVEAGRTYFVYTSFKLDDAFVELAGGPDRSGSELDLWRRSTKARSTNRIARCGENVNGDGQQRRLKRALTKEAQRRESTDYRDALSFSPDDGWTAGAVKSLGPPR